MERRMGIEPTSEAWTCNRHLGFPSCMHRSKGDHSSCYVEAKRNAEAVIFDSGPGIERPDRSRHQRDSKLALKSDPKTWSFPTSASQCSETLQKIRGDSEAATIAIINHGT